MSLYPPSALDGNQVLQHAFDDATQRLRVDAIISVGPVAVEIDMATDSIRLGDGTDYFTSTTIGSDVGLDVNIIGGSMSIEIDAADGDNVMVVGTEDGTTTGIQHVLHVDTEGNQLVRPLNTFVSEEFDTVVPSYPSSTQEIYVYKTGGTGGTTVATVTIDYVTASKNEIVSIVRT